MNTTTSANQNHTSNMIEITAQLPGIADTKNMENTTTTSNIMQKVLAYTAFAAYVTLACVNPMWVAIWTIAFFISVPFFTEVVNTIFPVDGDYLYRSPSPRMSDYYEAFSVIPDVEDHTPEVPEVTDTPSDLWENGYVPVMIDDTDEQALFAEVDYQLCLPMARETVRVIDYSEYTYRELQAMVKAARVRTSDIKLNAKKAALIEYLQSV